MMDTDEMTEEEIVRFVATLKRVRERGDEGRTAVVRTADLGAVIDGWLTALHERDEARAEVERLRSAVNEALLIAHTAPPPVHAAHWCLRLVETLHNALKTDGAL